MHLVLQQNHHNQLLQFLQQALGIHMNHHLHLHLHCSYLLMHQYILVHHKYMNHHLHLHLNCSYLQQHLYSLVHLLYSFHNLQHLIHLIHLLNHLMTMMFHYHKNLESMKSCYSLINQHKLMLINQQQ